MVGFEREASALYPTKRATYLTPLMWQVLQVSVMLASNAMLIETRFPSRSLSMSCSFVRDYYLDPICDEAQECVHGPVRQSELSAGQLGQDSCSTLPQVPEKLQLRSRKMANEGPIY